MSGMAELGAVFPIAESEKKNMRCLETSDERERHKVSQCRLSAKVEMQAEKNPGCSSDKTALFSTRTKKQWKKVVLFLSDMKFWFFKRTCIRDRRYSIEWARPR
jgi:hypothetical protein